MNGTWRKYSPEAAPRVHSPPLGHTARRSPLASASSLRRSGSGTLTLVLATAWPRDTTPGAERECGPSGRGVTAPAGRPLWRRGSGRASAGTGPGRGDGRPSARPRRVRLAVLGLTLAGMALAVGCERAEQPAPAPKAAAAPPSFVGSAKCAGCHPKETEAYRASDHARAMEPATDQTVLGSFNEARITHRGVTSTFFRRDGKFLVRTDGPDGKLGEFEITYTFGVDPLQQYLIPFPGGRLQALGLAWDTRPRAQGGQRWFHLYPQEALRPPTPLHWTGREQTWNFQCAECHSTDLRKRYDLATNTYATAWAELTVSCEECHGPGSAHVAWAEARPAGAPPAPGSATGLVVHPGRGDGAWTIKDSQRGIAEWTGTARSSAEVDVCARCHARRRPIVDPHPYGQPFLDTHVPALLEPHLYHADGQILGEVYEWGSFVQSRMQRAGVTCADCHEPHRTTLRAPGNAVCAQCHLPAKFDTSAHHHHRPEAEGARCVSCHMPARTYMVVDPRRDHSFPVPRPDLSVALGTPNACTGCHANRTASWAAARVAGWGGAARGTADFARTLEAARRGLPVAGPALAALATDRTQAGIVRATALAHLPEFPSAGAAPAVERGARRSRCPGPDGSPPGRGVAAPRPAWRFSPGPCSGIPCERCGSPPSRPSRVFPSPHWRTVSGAISTGPWPSSSRASRSTPTGPRPT